MSLLSMLSMNVDHLEYPSALANIISSDLITALLRNHFSIMSTLGATVVSCARTHARMWNKSDV